MGLREEMTINRYFKLNSISLCVLIIGLCIMPVDVLAAWGSPAEIISGSWGSGDDQFGIMYEDISDIFPKFTITSDAKIVIRDGVNRRLEVYSGTGNFESIINYRAGRHYTESTLADSYGFSGDFAGYGEGGANYFYRADQKVYINFSSTGQIIKTFTTRPLELGTVKSQSIGSGQYKSIVSYPDAIYQIITNQSVRKYYRDLKMYLYQIETFTETVGNELITSYKVHKYSKCGKEVSVLNIPRSQYEAMPPEASNYPTWKPVPIMEYGEPLVSGSGDVYTWARTKTQYKILKWTWVDDPNAPSGPDAPSGLSVIASTKGLYLTWTASPSDPGCVTNYEISRATSAGGVGSTVGTVTAGKVNYNDSSAAAGTTYYYKVRAVAGSEYSVYSNEVSGKK